MTPPDPRAPLGAAELGNRISRSEAARLFLRGEITYDQLKLAEAETRAFQTRLNPDWYDLDDPAASLESRMAWSKKTGADFLALRHDVAEALLADLRRDRAEAARLRAILAPLLENPIDGDHLWLACVFCGKADPDRGDPHAPDCPVMTEAALLGDGGPGADRGEQDR